MSIKKYIHKEKKNCENKTLYVFNDSPIRSFTVHMAFSYVNEQLSAQRLVNRPVQISSQSWRISSQEISSQVQFSSLFKQVSFNLLKKNTSAKGTYGCLIGHLWYLCYML